MHRKRVGEIGRKRDFEAPELKIAAETHNCTDLKQNPVAISVFIPSFSDVPKMRAYRTEGPTWLCCYGKIRIQPRLER